MPKKRWGHPCGAASAGLRGLRFILPAALVGVLLGAASMIDSFGEASISTAAPLGAHPYDFRAERLAEDLEGWKGARPHGSPHDELVVGLSWFAGVSVERSDSKGLAVIDLGAGTVAIELSGDDVSRLADVWLIDNRPGAGASAMPDPADLKHRVGSLRVSGEVATLQAEVDPVLFESFDVDQVVVTVGGLGPVEGGVLYGAPPLFERLHRMSRRLEQGLAPVAGEESSRDGLLGELPPTTAAATKSEGALRVLGALIDEGEDLFFNETFAGNGRTCGTCHPAENNFTLDPDFISQLPADDPLFVAELVDELNHELNGGLIFENPTLMREFALIVENTDGFDDLANNFVLRSPNHLFALGVTLGPPSGVPCETVPPFDRLGWGGDGSGGSGTLREFAIGAVIQHTPLTLGRVAGEDFRLPTDEELDALEAFQLSLGRRADPDLINLGFSNPDVKAGQDLFLATDGGKCLVCHEDAGALRKVSIGGTTIARNVNFDIGIFNVDHPSTLGGGPIPLDDGFGTDHTQRRCFGTFSTPSLIEAADTPPFEHNNVFETLEQAIGHYSTDAFNLESSAGLAIGGTIEMTEEEINQIGALLRVLNALQNLEDVRNCDTRARSTADLADSSRLLDICMADNQDAIDVLTNGPLGALHPVAESHLGTSLSLHGQARDATTTQERNAALNSARLELKAAREDMIEEDLQPAGPAAR